MRLTIEEENILAMYPGESRSDAIEHIEMAIEYADDEMQAVLRSVLKKLASMTDAEYTDLSVELIEE